MSWFNLENVCEIYQLYFGNFSYCIVIGIIIAFMLVKYRTRDGMAVLGVCAIIWILYLNPIVINFLASLTVNTRSVRIFWAFPIIIGLGYVCACLIENGRKWKQILVLVLTAALLFCTGGTILNRENYVAECNLYKIPDDVIEVADAIEENSRQEWEYPYVMTTIYLSTYLRQYDGNIRLLYGRTKSGSEGKELYNLMREYMDKDIPYEVLYDMGCQAIDKGVNMIVLLKYQVQNEALETLGFYRVDCLEDYYIFCYAPQEVR